MLRSATLIFLGLIAWLPREIPTSSFRFFWVIFYVPFHFIAYKEFPDIDQNNQDRVQHWGAKQEKSEALYIAFLQLNIPSISIISW